MVVDEVLLAEDDHATARTFVVGPASGGDLGVPVLGELRLGLQVRRALPRRHLLLLYVLHALLGELHLVKESLRAALCLRPGQSGVHTGGVLVLIHTCHRGAHHLLLMVRRDRAFVKVPLCARVDSRVVRAVVR